MLLLGILFIPHLSSLLPTAYAQANHDPVINSPTDGQTFTFEAGQGITAKLQIGATDSDGDFVSINNTPFPPGAFYEFVEQFEGFTDASITFQDGHPFVGTYEITFTAVDEHGASSLPVTINIVVIPPDYLDLRNAKLNPQKVTMQVKVDGNIAPTIQRPPYGFAALTSDGNGLLAVTTHAGILDSEDQEDPGDDVLHTHVVDVISSDDCVNGIKVVSASFESPGTLTVGSKKLKVSGAPPDSFGDFDGTIISFILTIEEGTICVNPVDSIAT
jgi:hypothetical protein